jgi:MFS transporter, DHA2 family, multidrug resistance protein
LDEAKIKAEMLDPSNPTFEETWDQLTAAVQAVGYDPVRARDMALGVLYRQVQQQALSLSYFDLFWLFSVAAVCAAPLVFLMRRSVAEKGAEVHAH